MKKSFTSKILLTALATVVIGAMSASAQVIYYTDYNASSPYSQNDSTNSVGVVYTFSDDSAGNSNGIGGTGALSLGFDASGVAGPVPGPAANYALNMFSNQQKAGTLATSSVAADYNLDFYISGLGLLSSPNTILLDVKFQSGSVSKTLTNLAITNTGFQHITLNLGTDLGFTTLTAANVNSDLQLKFYTYSSGGVDKFGRDAGNAIYVDNVTITQVPEPSSVALLGLGLFGWLARRRSRR